MRIAPPPQVFPVLVKPVSAVPLSPEVSKALIERGVFNHNPHQVVWTAGPNPAAGFQARPLPAGDSLITVLRDLNEQALPYLEHVETHGVADGIALLVAAPDVLRALTVPSRNKAEKVILLGTNVVRLAKITNQFLHVPHADTSLEVAATLFKIGEEVFISGAKQPAG